MCQLKLNCLLDNKIIVNFQVMCGGCHPPVLRGVGWGVTSTVLCGEWGDIPSVWGGGMRTTSIAADVLFESNQGEDLGL